MAILSGAAYWIDNVPQYHSVQSCALSGSSPTATTYAAGSAPSIGGITSPHVNTTIASDETLGLYIGDLVTCACFADYDYGADIFFGTPPNAPVDERIAYTYAQSAVTVNVAMETTSHVLFLGETGQVVEPVAHLDAGSAVSCLSMPSTTDAVGLIAAGDGELVAVDTTTSTIYGTTVSAIGACSARVTLATGISGVTALAASGAQMFFATSGGVFACSTTTGCGSSPTTLAATPGTVSSIAADSANVYWIGSAGGSTGLVTCARTGCGGFPTALAASATPTQGIALDSAYVYFVQSGKLYREAKW